MALPSSSSSSSEPESEKEKLLSKDEISSWEDKPRHIFWDKEQEEEYKPNEIISILGFGTAQVIACIVVGLAFVSGFCAVQLQPFLSARLYVEMQLTPTQESILSAVSLSGLIVASFPFGLLCDVIGRKKSLMLACFLMLVWNLLTCAAPNFGWLVFFRLLVSISRGTIAAGLLYFGELIPEKYVYLGPLIGTQLAGSTLGDLFAIFVGYFLLTDPEIKWQYYVIAMSAPMVMFLLLAPLFLEETPQYYLSKGNHEQAFKIMRRIAKLNGKALPDDLKLVLRKKHEHKMDQQQDRKSLFIKVITNWTFLRVWSCILVIGGCGRLINDGINFVMSDLLYVIGESEGDYCNGVDTQTYFLTKDDYLKMFYSQLSSFFTIFIAYPLMRFGVTIKVQSLGCFILCCVIVGGLYACPDALGAFFILSIVRIAMQISNIAATQGLVQLFIPTEVRGSILGLGNSVRTIPLPFYPLLTQELSKQSQHYVTSITLFVMVCGLIAAVAIPRDINKDLKAQDEALSRQKLQDAEKDAKETEEPEE